MLRVALAATTLFLLGSAACQSQPGDSHNPSRRRAVYSLEPHDPWDEIFAALFTRTVEAKVAEELGGIEPFESLGLFEFELRVSQRTVPKFEDGDRAIDPLYPTFISSQGVEQTLAGPAFSQLTDGLEAALAEKTMRTPVERALMQSDLWAAFDILEARRTFRHQDSAELLERRSRLLDLIARFIQRLALTSEEINALPDNYQARQEEPPLPGLFEPTSDWIELQWLPERMHDSAFDHRRAARVFVLPLTAPSNRTAFLRDLQRADDPGERLAAVALAIQSLLVTDCGRVVPTPLVNAVQIRTFIRNAEGVIVRGQVEQFEVSRRSLLGNPASGGFVYHGESTAAYLPSSGNDYGFASPQDGASPVIATLGSRCRACHFDNGVRIVTLAIHAFPPIPSIRSLDQLGNERAEYVAARKQASDQFRALIQRWRTP